MSFERLIRFEGENGQQQFGEPQIEDADELLVALQEGKLVAKVFEGQNAFDLSSQQGPLVLVKRLLPVLRREDVPIVKCIGLNYMAHSKLQTMLDGMCANEAESEKEDENRRRTHPSLLSHPPA